MLFVNWNFVSLVIFIMGKNLSFYLNRKMRILLNF